MPVAATRDLVEVADAVRRATRRLARRLRQNGGTGLSPTLGAALATIAREGPITLGALAAVERVAPPSITKIATTLVEAGLIARRVDDSDRRVVRVELTAEGRQQLDVARDQHTAWLADRLQQCTASELACLRDAAALLERLVDDEHRR